MTAQNAAKAEMGALPAADNPLAAQLFTGSPEPRLAMYLLEQLVDLLWLPAALSEDERGARMTAAMLMLQGIKPADELEGMLATQMVATHSAAMDCMRRAMADGQAFAVREQNLRLAAKLLALGTRQVETLDRHRGKGLQKMTVKHVHEGARFLAPDGFQQSAFEDAQLAKTVKRLGEIFGVSTDSPAPARLSDGSRDD